VSQRRYGREDYVELAGSTAWLEQSLLWLRRISPWYFQELHQFKGHAIRLLTHATYRLQQHPSIALKQAPHRGLKRGNSPRTHTAPSHWGW
jgi:hypothetical protein